MTVLDFKIAGDQIKKERREKVEDLLYPREVFKNCRCVTFPITDNIILPSDCE